MSSTLRLAALRVVIICAAAAIPAALCAFTHPRAPQWGAAATAPDEVALATALSARPSPLWIDARAASVYAIDHVPGALPLNLTEWDEHIRAVVEAWSPGRLVVVYCDQQACQESRHVAEILRRDYGFGDVRVLQGGWRSWLAR